MDKTAYKIGVELTFNTPILFTVFNRPDLTKIIFESIRNIKPTILYIAADGPRENKIGEDELCRHTRDITEKIDWPCKVYRKYSEKNMGCKIGMSSAINWFFENIDEGIILEDDCLPDVTFFRFCSELLERYRGDTQIKMITGDNFNFGEKFGNESYYFSHIPSIWGWATWKRAWTEYDLEMKSYPDFIKENKIKYIFNNTKIQKYWINIFNDLYKNKVDTWDGQWVYSIYNKNGICIRPNVNLVKNIGFNINATHTKSDNKLGNINNDSIKTINHPSLININTEADEYLFETIMHRTFMEKVISKILKK